MDLIQQFIDTYKMKWTFYDAAGRLAAEKLQLALQNAGIRAIVTSRAKNPARLRTKVQRRTSRREEPYQTLEEIYDDIADLSGVRVSLYFPGDRGKVDAIISELFNILEFKQFPEQSKPPTYHKRFSGYWANHYRARMRDEILNESQKKYGSARIEIQVASLIMHAWSEVEHDLIYKPMQGTLSEEELSILDELNGLVLAGEIALERLQAAGNERLRSRNAAFGSQYELASYLYNFLSSHLKTEDIELRMGNIALLYRLLQRLQLTGLKDITPILRSVKFEKDRRTISQQIIDQIISGNEKRYQCYQELRTEPETASPETLQAVNQFLEEWVPLERLLNKTARRTSTRSRGAFNINTLKRMDLFDKEMINQIVQLRKLRNVLIHDIELPDQTQILRCTEEAKALLAQLTGQHDAMADGENGEKNSHAENTYDTNATITKNAKHQITKKHNDKSHPVFSRMASFFYIFDSFQNRFQHRNTMFYILILHSKFRSFLN